MSFIAGKYTVTYDNGGGAITIGQVSAGFTLEHVVSKQLITGDAQGDSVQDAIYRGHNVFIEFTMMEYDQAGALDVFWPYPGASGLHGDQGVIGRADVQALGGGIAGDLVLTVVAGSPADAASGVLGPQMLTANHAILAEDFPVRMLFAPALRDIPVRLRLYPYDRGSGNIAFFELA
jgi:hypothetical protein